VCLVKNVLMGCSANDITQQKGKKTINNEEILSALEIAEFDMMIPQLKKHIERTSPVIRATADFRIRCYTKGEEEKGRAR
jgi:uncharacterized small protein (DUF1192 family)